jgi:hypothetical protein
MNTPPPWPQVKEGMSGKSKGCLGCSGLVVIFLIISVIASLLETGQQKQDFERDRSKIMSDIQEAAKAGDHTRIVEISKPYHLVEDYEFRKLISASQKELNSIASAERQKREAITAAETEKKAQAKISEARHTAQKDAGQDETGSNAAMNESFKLGGFSYTISSAQRTPNFGLNEASILAVYYQIKNEGNESAVVSTSDFEVVDSKGRKFTPDSKAMAEFFPNAEADFGLTELQPGISENGGQVFKLPESSFDGSLILVVPEKGIFSTGAKRVKLGL